MCFSNAYIFFALLFMSMNITYVCMCILGWFLLHTLVFKLPECVKKLSLSLKKTGIKLNVNFDK